jgi:hypothetical protein
VVIANYHLCFFDEFRRRFSLNAKLVESPFEECERVGDEVIDLRLELLLAFDQFCVFLALNRMLLFYVDSVSFGLKKKIFTEEMKKI